MATDITDLIGETLRGAVQVGRARYESRAAGAADQQTAALDARPIPGTDGRAGAYTSPGISGINPLWIGLGVAALAVVLFLARR